MTGETTFVFSVLAAAVVLFASGRVRTDVVALLVVLALVLSGVLTLREGLAGFGDPVIILMGGLFVVGEALVTTGVTLAVGQWLIRVGGGSETRLLILVMLVGGGVGAFLGSTGVVALFLPIVLGIANKTDLAARRLLMPLAIAALIGGMITLVGAPANLVINAELRNLGHEAFEFFEFTPIGATVLLVGTAFMLLIGRGLLITAPGDKVEKPLTLTALLERYGLADRMHRLRVPAGTDLVGQAIASAKLRSQFGIASVAIEQRQGERRTIGPALADTTFAAEDVLYAIGTKKAISNLIKTKGLQRLDLEKAPTKKLYEELGMAEVLLPPESELCKQTIAEAGFRDRYRVSVLALRRRGEATEKDLSERTLRSGDTLLVSGSWKDIGLLSERKHDLIVLTLPAEMEDFAPESDKAPWALAIVAAMVGAMVLELAPNAVCALVAALALIAAGCLSMDAAYRSIRWSTLVLVGGMLPLATALQKTDATDVIVAAFLAAFGELSPTLVMVALFVLTILLTTFVSSIAASLLVAPIAIGIAEDIGVAPQAFAMAVAIAASAGFMTPVSSSANALVTAPGGYTFADFAKVGAPMVILVMVVTVLLAPLLFPF